MFAAAFSPVRLRAQFLKEVLSVLRDPLSRMASLLVGRIPRPQLFGDHRRPKARH